MSRAKAGKVVVMSAAILLAGLGGTYAYFRSVGVVFKTTTEALVLADDVGLPGRHAPFSRVALTPAPWPGEARTIYRLANLGIPVEVRLAGSCGPASLRVDAVDGAGRLAINTGSSLGERALMRCM